MVLELGESNILTQLTYSYITHRVGQCHSILAPCLAMISFMILW